MKVMEPKKRAEPIPKQIPMEPEYYTFNLEAVDDKKRKKCLKAAIDKYNKSCAKAYKELLKDMKKCNVADQT